MWLAFEKWHGARNDFLVTWLKPDGGHVLQALKNDAAKLCDRRSGVGADGILVLHLERADSLLPSQLTIINADGSLADMCGNGLRCAAGSILKTHREKGNPREPLDTVALTVEGRAVTARFLGSVGGDNATPLVAVDLGEAVTNESLSWWAEAQGEVQRVERELGIKNLSREMGAADIGNRHLVLSRECLSVEELRRVGAALQKSSHWDGINVHLVCGCELSDRDRAWMNKALGGKVHELFEAMPWERGVGETQACGSGAVAVATVAMASGVTPREGWNAVRMPGGVLFVRQEKENGHAVLAGEARFVFAGSVEI